MSGQRVLVVDDEAQILRALRTTLRGAGYEVDTADTAEGALAAAALRPPDAVILDLVLPDGTGVEVCRELRKWSAAPVIVLSAVGDEGQKVAALDAGADDYVTKPVGVDELLARLRASLRRVVPSGEPIVTVGELAIDLEKQPAHLKDRELRFRKLTIEPGGIVPWHSHDDRPAIIFVQQGEIVEYASNCSEPIVHKAGDIRPEVFGTSHWWKNLGKETVILYVGDVRKDPHDHNM